MYVEKRPSKVPMIYYACEFGSHGFVKCKSCNLVGYLAKVCTSNSKNGKNDYVEIKENILEMFQLNTKFRLIGFKSAMVNMMIENVLMSMKLDSGTGISNLLN